jgi:Reverse transcriptase (RNA-dependent DNA polymerase)
VAQGCRQVIGVDVGEVFAPVSTCGARRAILCKGAREELEVHQVDIESAFLHGVLEERNMLPTLLGLIMVTPGWCVGW